MVKLIMRLVSFFLYQRINNIYTYLEPYLTHEWLLIVLGQNEAYLKVYL